MTHDLDMAPDHNESGAEFILETDVGPLGGATLAVAHSIGGLELFLFSTNVGPISGAIHSCAN